MQSYTSRHTSINSRKVPKVYKKLIPDKTHRIIFDYGCGKFTDHIVDSLPEYITYVPYDPFNQPYDVNERGIRFLNYLASTKNRPPMDIVCANVLNVIDDTEVVSEIGKLLSTLHNETGCGVYISVYEGDKSGVGRRTGKDQYQRNEQVQEYQKFFPGSLIRDKMIIMERI